MRIDKRSLVFRLLLPIFAVIAIISLTLLAAVTRISSHIIEDYHRSMLAEYSAESRRILDSALAELTTARLLENPAVAGSKQRTVIEAISLNWRQHGIDGIIAGPDQQALFTTLPADLTARVLSLAADGYFPAARSRLGLRGQAFQFTPWNWTVVTLTRSQPSQQSRREVRYLVPIVAFGALLMITVLFVILWRRLQRPVAAMIGDVRAERDVAPIGVAEFDQIGAAINDALGRVRERTAALIEKDERFQLLLRSTAEGIYGVDTEGNCTFCNPACLRMLGYGEESDLLGKNTHQAMHHSFADGRPYPEQECRIYSAYKAGRGVHADDEVFWRKDGGSFPVEYWSYPLVAEGAVAGAVVTFIDITERRKHEEFIRNILETVDEGFLVIDRDYTVLSANRAYSRQVGIPLDSIIGRKCHEISHGSMDPCTDDAMGCSARRTFETGEPCSATHQHLRRGGPDQKIEVKAYPVRDRRGAVSSVILTTTDVTEKSRLEQQLSQAQKMEAIGQLAGGIAHDFNNVLTAIVGYASLLKRDAQEGGQSMYYAEQILGSAERAASLTRQILAFSRKQVLMPRPVDLNQVIRGMERLMTRLLGEDIEIRMHLADGDVTVLADVGQLEQVLMNLCTNARDAMPSGGLLVISTDMVALEADAAAAYGLPQAGRYAQLAIADTGSGMDAWTQQRIFEPFFTTKEMGRGTGLGLSIVYGIIKQHQGQITVYSEPGKGTTFKIYLPLTGSAEHHSPAPMETAVRGGTETILLAEDSEEVRRFIQHVLEQYGYRVIAAADGEEAVRRFREREDAIKLCLFDLIMPKMNGREAIEEIRRSRSGMKAVFMSGYTADVIRERDILQKDTVFLAKPIQPQDLLRAVRHALDAGSGG